MGNVKREILQEETDPEPEDGQKNFCQGGTRLPPKEIEDGDADGKEDELPMMDDMEDDLGDPGMLPYSLVSAEDGVDAAETVRDEQRHGDEQQASVSLNRLPPPGVRRRHFSHYAFPEKLPKSSLIARLDCR